jgi:hypothetical protein
LVSDTSNCYNEGTIRKSKGKRKKDGNSERLRKRDGWSERVRMSENE